jgi:methionine-rich copper-binding protein CopC
MQTSWRLSLRACLTAAAFLIAQSAFAHAHPKQRMPGADATVGANLRQVSIEFDDVLEPAFSSLQVSDATGKSVTAGKSSVDANDKKHMTVALEALKPGVYTVSWVAVAADGHRTQGHYTFTVK